MAKPETRTKIGLLGCGNMGSSIVRGLVENSFYPQNIWVYDPDKSKITRLKKDAAVRVAKTSRQVASIVDVVIVAVKPDVVEPVLNEIALATLKTTLILSIAAGVKIAAIQKCFKEKVPVIRVMPNSPAQFGEGMSAYCLGAHAEPRHEKIAREILAGLGDYVEVKENLMDLVTAVSGSGPAYFFLLTQALIQAACEEGMKADVAKRLVIQTAVGSAKEMKETGEDPEVLIERVASKRGTTEAALRAFSKRGFGKTVADAVRAAAKRSRELSG